MDVKVVNFILFVLAGECHSLTDERDLQVERNKGTMSRGQVDDVVDEVLEKIYDKSIGFDKRLTSVDKRVSRLENLQTPMDTFAKRVSRLENSLTPKDTLAYRSLKLNQDAGEKVPKSEKSQKSPKPTQEFRPSETNQESGSKPKCSHECEIGENQCRHVTEKIIGTLIGTCVGFNCKGVSEECGPCYEKCPIQSEPKCEYNCKAGPNSCTQITQYPPGLKEYCKYAGGCFGTRCAGETAECGKCFEHCSNIRTEPKCDYECKDDGVCKHSMDYNGEVIEGGCTWMYFGKLLLKCVGESDKCPTCYEKCKKGNK